MNLCIRCCNGCMERTVGCHETCPRYNDEKGRNEEIRQIENMKNISMSITESRFRAAVKRLKKCRRKKLTLQKSVGFFVEHK